MITGQFTFHYTVLKILNKMVKSNIVNVELIAMLYISNTKTARGNGVYTKGY